MSEESLQLKYDILKARIVNLVEEHADALARAQVFQRDFNIAYEKWQEAERKISALEETVRNKNVQEEKPRVIITEGSVETTDNKS